MKLARILYFVNGPAPTPDDFQAAEKIGANVVFRNAQSVPDEGSLETCDGVAGLVPERYAAVFPTAAEAISKKKKEAAELREKVGDEIAPTKPVTKPKTVGATVNPAAGATGVDPAAKQPTPEELAAAEKKALEEKAPGAAAPQAWKGN